MRSEQKEKILKKAKENYNIAMDHWSEFFNEAKDVLNFINGDQWNWQIKKNREDAGLPTMTVNQIPTYIKQITNEIRQNTPSIQIDPANNEASEEAAEFLGDLIRAIENDSDAASAYEQAAWYACAIGMGFFRITTEYVDDVSFDQKLTIKRVEDPTNVLIDPLHKEVDASDAQWCFVIGTLTKEEYKKLYGKSNLASLLENKAWTRANRSKWLMDDTVQIAEYFWIEKTKTKLYKVRNNLDYTQYNTTIEPDEDLILNGTLEILDERTTELKKVRWVKMNDVEILEDTEWYGTRIPIIAVKGNEMYVDGKRRIRGAVWDAMDSQRAFNNYFSLQAELMSLTPKSPYIVEVTQVQNFEHLWRDSNISPLAYLPYTASTTAGGQMIPPPFKADSSPNIQAAMQICMQAKDNLKAIFGIYDATLGAQGNETSGKAILARTEQSHNSNYHYMDNLRKSIKTAGRILLDCIPEVYSEEREVQIMKLNGDSTISRINSSRQEFDFTRGAYALTVDTGPSYATKRQEAVERMVTLGQVYPNAMPLIADLIASESDWPGAKQIANRLRLALPLPIQQAEAAEGKIPSEQQAMLAAQQAQQMQQQLVMMQQKMQELNVELQNEREENKLMKIKAGVDLQRANMDKELKERQLQLQAAIAQQEYEIKLKELALDAENLKINKAKAAIDGLEAAHDVAKEALDRTSDHVTMMVNPTGFNENTLEK